MYMTHSIENIIPTHVEWEEHDIKEYDVIMLTMKKESLLIENGFITRLLIF
jgi:hypothetical protein